MQSSTGTPLPFTIAMCADGERARVCLAVGEGTVGIYASPEVALAMCTELNHVVSNPHTYAALAAHFPTPTHRSTTR